MTQPTSSPSTGTTPGQDFGRRLARVKTIAAVLIVVVAIAAGTIGYELHPASTSSSSKNVSLTYFDDLAPSESSYMTATVLPAFEAQYPNITVVYSNLAASNIVTEVEALVNGHDVGTTVIAEDNLVIGELVYGGYLMNMSSIASTFEPTTMIPSMAGIANYELKAFGGTYFVPLRANVPLFWYNASALSAAGISAPPTTLAQLTSDAQTLAAAHGNVGQLMFQGHGGASTPTELFQWLTQFGGNPMLFNNAGDLQAFQYLYNLSAYFNPGYTQGYWGTYTGLANGGYAMVDYQWPYIYSDLLSLGMTNSEIGVYPGPSGPVNSDHLIGGDVLAMPKGESNVWAAEQFSHYLLSTPVQQGFIENLSWPAVNAAAYNGLNASTLKVYGPLEQAIQNPVFRPPVAWISEWQTIMDNVWTTIIVNHASYASIQGTLNSANQQLDSYLSTNYGSAVATAYEQGAYGPLIV